jgi:hypothetical protein
MVSGIGDKAAAVPNKEVRNIMGAGGGADFVFATSAI